MADARARGWGDPGTPGTASATAYRKAHIVTIDVGGIRLSVRREVAPLFAGFIAEIVKQGYDLTRRADDWGYVCRYIRGYEEQKILSNHSWGLAIDLNAADHPLGQRGTGVPRFVVEAAYDHGLYWGGDYKTRPDEMHFEYLGTPQDAARLIASMHPPTAPLTPPVYGPIIPETAMQPIDVQIATDADGHGYIDLPVESHKVVSVVFNTANPAGQGYKPTPDWARLNVDGKARIVIEEALPNGRLDATVWVV